MKKLTPQSETDQPLPVLSKFLRRLAYRYNKSGIGHWLPLIFATKVNIWGRFLTNIKKSILPKFLPKNRNNMPLTKYNRIHSQGVTAARILVTTFVIAAIFTAARKRKKTKKVSG